MAKDQFGNELGVNAQGTTTFNGRTMLDYINAEELPAGYYADPEGAIRQLEGSVDASGNFVGTNGKRGYFGGRHSIATFENGQIVAFESPAADDPSFGARPQPSAADATAQKQAGLATALADLHRKVDELGEMARG